MDKLTTEYGQNSLLGIVARSIQEEPKLFVATVDSLELVRRNRFHFPSGQRMVFQSLTWLAPTPECMEEDGERWDGLA